MSTIISYPNLFLLLQLLPPPNLIDAIEHGDLLHPTAAAELVPTQVHILACLYIWSSLLLALSLSLLDAQALSSAPSTARQDKKVIEPRYDGKRREVARQIEGDDRD